MFKIKTNLKPLGKLFGCILFVMVLCGFSTPAYGTANPSTLSITTSDHVLPISITPTPDGAFGKSSNNTVTVTTDNYSGYTLTISSDEVMGAVDTDENEIPTLPAGTSISEATFSAGSIYNNKLGYKPNQYVTSSGGTNTVVQNSNYLSLPSLSGDLLAVTNSANVVADTYTLGFAARVDTSLPAGTYIYTYVLTAVANDIVFNITYDDNTTDSVTNMPVPNPQVVTIDGGTPAAESYATLSDAIPVRNEKKFAEGSIWSWRN